MVSYAENELTIIKMLWEGKTYQIYAESIDDDDKQDTEKVYTSDDADAKKVTFGKCEYTIDLKGVLPQHKQLFNWIRERQRKGVFTSLPRIAIYEYVDGKIKLMSLYNKVFVTDISRTNKETFDVKMEALTRVYRDSKNALI